MFRSFPELVFTISLKRRPWFHILSFILPCALLSVLNLLVFILPTVSGEKISFSITNLLALLLFQQFIGDNLPPTSNNMPIISKENIPNHSEISILTQDQRYNKALWLLSYLIKVTIRNNTNTSQDCWVGVKMTKNPHASFLLQQCTTPQEEYITM